MIKTYCNIGTRSLEFASLRHQNYFASFRIPLRQPCYCPHFRNQIARRAYCAMPELYYRASDLKARRAARVLVIDPTGRVLLFEYAHKSNDSLSNKGSYYTVPGGKVEEDETFETCARRELEEETGLNSESLGPAQSRCFDNVLAIRQAPLLMPSGEFVIADERYYAVFVNEDQAFDSSKWTESEKQNISQLHWCTPTDLERLKTKNLWPTTLDQILESAINKNHDVLEFRSTREQIGDVIVNVQY